MPKNLVSRSQTEFQRGDGQLTASSPVPLLPIAYPVGAQNQYVWTSDANGNGSWQSPGTLTLLATTGVNGYALVNGTGNILSWTAPNDGNLHRVMFFAAMNVTGGQTGGEVDIDFTLPDGSSWGWGLFSGGQSTGFNYSQGAHQLLVQANSAVTVTQQSALTGGAATMWAEIWGS